MVAGPARVFEGEEAMLSALSESPQSLKVGYLAPMFVRKPFLVASLALCLCEHPK
jgi:hypothetical protein